MSKHEQFKRLFTQPAADVLPDIFNLEAVQDFFSGGSAGKRDTAISALEKANDINPLDVVLNDRIDFLSGASDAPTADHMPEASPFGHHDEDGHDHGTGEFGDGDAAAKPDHAGGGKTGDGGGKGGGKGKDKTKDNTAGTDDGTGSTDGTDGGTVVTDGGTGSTDGTDGGSGGTDSGTGSTDGTDGGTGGTDSGTGGTDTGGSTNFGWTSSNTYVSGADTPDGFNVELVFHGSWTDSQKQIAAQQAEILSDAITGDLASGGGIDDVRLNMYNEGIDGGGNRWGEAGWMQLRDDYTVLEGGVRIDSADIASVEDIGRLDDLFLHEMLHAIGVGTTWSYLGLIDGNTFIGENAMDVYGGAVPLSDSAHWNETLLGQEAGSKLIDNNEEMTDLTLAALEDMGYETTYGDFLLG